MFDPWDGVLALRQPCLLKPISNQMLNESGGVRAEILSAIDRLLRSQLSEQAEALPDSPAAALEITSDQRWLNTSAMQKAIRRGQPERAARHCMAGMHIDRRHTFRRLATCALEDVGIADLQLTSLCLAALGSKAFQQGERGLAIADWLARRLARCPKSRLACDLLSIVDYNPKLAGEKSALSRASTSQLLDHASVDDTETKMLALWTLAGTRRFAGVTMPLDNARSRAPLMAHMAANGMPLLLYYIADRAAARLSDAMFVSILPIWNLLKGGKEFQVIRRLLPASRDIGAFAAEAYDLHTRAGKSAISQLAKASTEISARVAGLSSGQRRVALEHAVFIAEGRLAATEILTPACAVIARHAGYCELAFAGLADVQRQADLLACIDANLPLLNNLRATTAKFT